jgi:hypothetical protein
MKRVTVKNLEDVTIAIAELEDPVSWINEGIANNWWGEVGTYTVDTVDITTEYETQVAIANRQANYPTYFDFLNAFCSSNSTAELDALKAAKLAVDAEYPLPEE